MTEGFISLLREKATVWKNVLCVVGAAYATKVVISWSWKTLRFVREYFLCRLYSHDIKRFGGWAVVTGAADGIGKAYSQKLAACGYNIVLIDRSHGNLQVTADALALEHGVDVRMIAVEFGADQSIYGKMERQLGDIDVGIIVNNVGVMYDYPNFFLEISHQTLWNLIQVNIAATTFMTHIILPKMLSRGCGAVINISTGAAHRPCPQLAAYTASKIYVQSLSEALHHEYRHKGIVVQCVSPLLVYTQRNRALNPGFFLPHAETFVDHAICTLGRQMHTAGYWPHALQVGALNLLPSSLFNYFANHVNTAMRRIAVRSLKKRQSGTNITDCNPTNSSQTSQHTSSLTNESTNNT
ncbi:inactive hydroxysteroid dehydrogenase-like protein 1 [Corticium candelabrum]|uniref:inactive hydroxysteroid dehydrogenase-like protein 1 n=1 Tax=Corticium candelabrum TaxID=121492 RepID=UPI002E2748BF|nr:inactive hydroxysteroid dehydrogenase-like protein 1 [Corticium candelabrum]